VLTTILIKIKYDINHIFVSYLVTEYKTLSNVFKHYVKCVHVHVLWYRQEATPDLRKRCYTALRIAFERLKNEEEFYREIVLRYIAALRKIGCPNIADSVERRHLHKFYLNAIDN